MNTTYIPILGMPRSGKTTFLAALWHILTSNEFASRLALDKMIGNQEHLNQIVASWRRCEEVARTSTASEAHVEIHAHDRLTGSKVVLGFPDLSGESFELQFASRSCTQEYLSSFADASGLMLFVNADRSTDPLTIIELESVVGPMGTPDGDLKPWSPRMVPEQARLVDLLQFLQEHPFERRLRRLVIAVSAWDVVSRGKTPGQWLEHEMPLLHQFLNNNGKSFEISVFGVSAQGGSTKDDRERLLDQAVPSDRIRCVGTGIDSNDITLPIAWLSGD